MKTSVLIKKKSPVKIKTNLNLSAKGVGPDYSFPIVAIGASAGGLDAITELLINLPVDTGMAFIYVQHLSPDHKSILTTLLSKSTLMRVQEVTDRILMRPNHFYVIPPDKEMTVLDGHIKLSPRPKVPVMNFPIDTFFSTLADKHKEGAIGIILSGSASDGTRGMKAIKHGGGLTFAQDDSAKFSSMPMSAIASGAVDFILSPKEIALERGRLSKHPFVGNGITKDKGDLIENSHPALKNILSYLLKATGVDFRLYKMNTIKRRIMRRMLLYKITTLKDYAKLISEKKEEIDILYQDLLINVTRFFRDTDAHQYLKSTLLPRLLKNKKKGEILRIWVPACATGEEAYSFAMMILEIKNSNSTGTPVQIFATDLSEKAISKARIGVYTKQEIEFVSPRRVQRFYTKSETGYRISKAVRDMCVFASHNLLTDPPFSRLDFISCCNLFIYLDTAAQKKALNTFHYALNDKGYLMLGKSEAIGSSAKLFTAFNNKFKIFARNPNSGARSLPALTPRFSKPLIEENMVLSTKLAHLPALKKKSPFAVLGLDKAIDEVLVAEFMPASVVINHQMEVLQFRGLTDLFLTHSPGKASLNILKLARQEIAFELQNAIAMAIKSSKRVRKTGIEMKIKDAIRAVSIEIVPLKIEWDEPLLLILFAELEQVEIIEHKVNGSKYRSKAIGIAAKDRRIKKLEDELADARADALRFAQEQEVFTEELQSASEEVVSSNEELQSVNEELETSKEEIESANEELTTTNQELQTRNDLLNESYHYSEAIIDTIHEPMIILDKNLCIKSVNKSFYKKFDLLPDETEGKPLFDLDNKQWNVPQLRKALQSVVTKNAQFSDFEITYSFAATGVKTMLLNASPIIQKTHGEQLILLAINDITERRRLQLIEQEILKKDNLEQKSQNLKLEKAVEVRTRELNKANQSLGITNSELIKINEELNSFTYVASHDLQEPLRKIQTFISRITDKANENLSAKSAAHFTRISKAAERMQKLLIDLLAFSRVNVAERKFENVHLSAVIQKVKEDLKEDLEEKKATISLARLLEVRIIPFQFHQLMTNLICNSLKYSKQDVPPRIQIKSTMVKGSKTINPGLSVGKSYCHITLSDNGIGFEPQYNEKIFEIFQKLHSKEKYEGTGIGLTIVKKVVDIHHGIITAIGKLGKGARFDIYIPA